MDMPFSGGLPKFENGGSLTVDTSVFEGLVPGMGGGMDDIVPAVIDGMEPVLLSRDEYVIPADVVSHIGDGSTTRGGELLDDMINNIRRQKTDTTEQPAELDETPEDIMAMLRVPTRLKEWSDEAFRVVEDLAIKLGMDGLETSTTPAMERIWKDLGFTKEFIVMTKQVENKENNSVDNSDLLSVNADELLKEVANGR